MERGYHFIGIGGIGMSGLAKILLKGGIKVRGSDVADSALVEELRKEGAEIFIGHSEKHLLSGSKVVYNTDIPKDNPEYRQAEKNNCTLLHRSDVLKELMQGYLPLLVTGTHGKTTTSSLLSHVLIELGFDPAVAVGGVVTSIGTNARYGRGRYFIAEADESDGTFIKYPCHAAIVTNIDLDHMNHWKSEEALLRGFDEFKRRMDADRLFWCYDDLRLRSIYQQGVSYGFSKGADVRVVHFEQKGWKIVFSCEWNGRLFEKIEIPLIGRHNVLNATAVFALVLQLGASEELLRKAFLTFQGVGRRAEKRGEVSGIAFYDDYGHHPTEIAVTLQALKEAVGNRRLVALFQPHRYTRTRDCFHEFASAFESADLVVLTDIYSAKEPPIAGITSEALFQTLKRRPGQELHLVAKANLLDFVQTKLKPADVVVTMGAGDITKFASECMDKLREGGQNGA